MNSLACQCNSRWNIKGICHVKSKLGEQSPSTRTASLCNLCSPSIPLFTFLLLFFSFSKSLQPRVLLWYSQPHLEPEAIQELLLHLAVDTEGAWCCGSHPQVSPGSQAGKVCSSGASVRALGKRTSESSSINASLLIKSCSWGNCQTLIDLCLPRWMGETGWVHSSVFIKSGVGYNRELSKPHCLPLDC